MKSLETATARRSGWLAWIFGAALLAAVVSVALHFSEGREFVLLAESAEPSWLLLALLLQAATYVPQAEIWRRVSRAAGFPLPLGPLYALSLAKLFIDQALPSAGLSGTIVMARSLEDRGVPRSVVMAAVVINIASYYSAYVISLVIALVITLVRHQLNPLVELVAVLFALFGIALSVAVLVLSGRAPGAVSRRLSRLRPLRSGLELLEAADQRLSRDPRRLIPAVACQLAIMLLDTATMWTLVQALGATATPGGIFASFMLASLFRTVGVLPGGLGSFEAMSVLTLKMIGVAIPVGLSATLMFRALSFWLPMLPGLWFSRRAMAGSKAAARQRTVDTYWAVDPSELCRSLQTSTNGLSSAEAAERLRRYGPNELREQQRLSRARVLLAQVRSPLLLLLLFAAIVSALTGEWVDAAIVLTILCASIAVGYTREYSAQAAAAALRLRVKTRANVVRDGRTVPVPLEDVVPGDVVLLSAGSLVPADAVVLEATDCFASEAVLTGESFPVEKKAGDSRRHPRRSRSARTACSSAPTSAAVRARSRRRYRSGDGVRRHRAPAGAAAAGNGVRPRHPSLRLHADQRDVGHGTARVRGTRHPRTAADRNVALLDRARRRAQPRAASRDSEHQPGQRRRDDGGLRRARAAPQRHRKPRQHGRAVHGQDRHADRRRRQLRGWLRPVRHPLRCRPRARRGERRSRDRAGKPAGRSHFAGAHAGAHGPRQARRDPLRLHAQAGDGHRRGSEGCPASHQGSVPPHPRDLHSLARRRSPRHGGAIAARRTLRGVELGRRPCSRGRGAARARATLVYAGRRARAYVRRVSHVSRPAKGGRRESARRPRRARRLREADHGRQQAGRAAHRRLGGNAPRTGSHRRGPRSAAR